MNLQPYLELTIDLLDEIPDNPAVYYPGICVDCGDYCEPEYKRCWRCQREADWQEYQDVKHAAQNGTL